MKTLRYKVEISSLKEEGKGMIFLDANAFYSYMGRKNVGLGESAHVKEKELRGYLDSIFDKSLPTSVFIEIMVHFRDDKKRLKQILDFRGEKKLSLFNNIPDYCVSDVEMNCIYHMSDNDLKKYAYQLLNTKIDIESRFSYLFYEITRNLYLEYRLSEMNKFTENQEKGIWEFLGRKEFQENQEVVTNEFKNALKVGYEQGKDQNILKEKYIDVLNDACKVIDLTLAGCAACIENQIDIIEAIQKANAESDSKGFDGLNGTMPGIVSVLQTNIKFLEYAKQRISDMFLKHGYNRYQTDYLKEVMFNAWFDRAQKLKKNDIFDMLCAGCLGYIRPLKQGEVILANTNSYIISFDSTMEKYIHIVRPDNIKLIQKFKNKI